MSSPAGRPRRYFDNAATSFPKPPGVAAAMHEYLTEIGASAGRGAYREALESARVLSDCRDAIRSLFRCRPIDSVIFTLNGTDALNLAIKGLARPGAHVVTTCVDHNSVLRPLSALETRAGVRWTAVAVDPRSTLLDPDDLARAIQPDTVLVAVNHASNVTGALQPLADIAQVCRARGVPLLVDGAQSAGHVPIDFHALGLDLLACPGHKGLLGPLGTGVLVIRAGLESRLDTLREGGTGSQSELPHQPGFSPDKFEAGSHNAVGLAGLLAALRWIRQRGVAALREHELALCRRMRDQLEACEQLQWFGPRDVQQRVGVFSVRSADLSPAELSGVLESEAGLLTRSGLHCAPFAHTAIGTDQDGGTTRFSFGPFLTLDDVDAAGAALRAVSRPTSAATCHP